MQNKVYIPSHVAIIMDGNGRWAEKNGFERSYGHLMGVESVKEVIEVSLKIGVRYLTLYAFSSENWSRPKKEVDYLMELFCSTIVDQNDMLKKNGVKVLFMGDIPSLSPKVQKYIELCETETVDNSTLTLVIALNYSARNELVNATKRVVQSVVDGALGVADITEDTIKNNLYLGRLPDPDLIIRTSGECRLSNFMLWQASYSEFYFTEILWPEFKELEYMGAINSFSKRQRRFGNI